VNGRTVFLAKPAFDTQEAYLTLVRELRGRGYAVMPEPDRDLPHEGRAAREAIRSALANAELSIHFVGEARGFQPDGLDAGIVKLQLADAAAEEVRRPGFQRLIWAPKILPTAEDTVGERDPLQVLARFDPGLPSDEIVGDTPARFNEFVIQRLDARTPPKPVAIAPAKPVNVFLAAAPVDQKLILATAKQLKEFGIRTIFAPADTAFAAASRADHLVLCWGEADELTVMDTLDRLAAAEWRSLRPNGKICLLVFGPANDTKDFACEIGDFGAADHVLDATNPLDRETITSILNTGSV
jgi:hypothetical protein